MSDVCKQLKGWFRSFTTIETHLTVAQALLFVGFIALLTFLILHLIACTRENEMLEDLAIDVNTENTPEIVKVTSHEDYVTPPTTSDKVTGNGECSWTPSHKTDAVTHYYYNMDRTTINKDHNIEVEMQMLTYYVGEEDESEFVIALVKIGTVVDLIFGCILTVVATHWAITAASCIESIEELDSLDAFVMVERFGEINPGSTHTVSDVMIHPFYQGTNKSYDLAALRSEDTFTINHQTIPKLSTIFDYFLINLGETLDIFGFGNYRSNDKRPKSRRLRKVSVSVMPLQSCETNEEERWAMRHLSTGEDVLRGACCARGVCAGLRAAVGHGDGPPCTFCAGAPLVRAGVLLGIMGDNPHCGLSCAPALYVALAPLSDWLLAVTNVSAV